jgi:choline dehydrogenase-like flavoprotein
MSAEQLPVDVVVVGAGPSGAIVSYILADRGFSVACLEQGDWVSPSDYPANNREWELQVQNQWSHDPNIRRLDADYPLDVSDSDMQPVMYNAVGGTTIFYGGQWIRMLPSDFRVRSMDGVASDWPISYEDLHPYYSEMEQFIGVSGLSGDTCYPPGIEYPFPPHPLGRVGLKAAAGANALGWHWWPGTHSIAVSNTKHLARCARWGVCEWGCPEGAKASADLAIWPDALKAGAQLVTGARVRKIESRGDGRVTGVTWIDTAGDEHFQPANAVVVCSNSIGTARLLLLSDSPSHPDGLANSSGMVGRHLMLHPNSTVTGYYDEDLESHLGPAGALINCMEFYETRPEHDFLRGVKFMALPTPGPLMTVESHRPLGYDVVWGEEFLEVASRAQGGLLWAANTDDLPDPSNRVTLDPVLKDSSGIPAPKIEYRISENTRRQLRFALERMTELHHAGGAHTTIPVELWIDQPGHLMGTARMGVDPETSVVDAFGSAHDSQNLFIADGSLFVTAGSANPTATICALALRVGRHIAETARDQESVA